MAVLGDLDACRQVAYKKASRTPPAPLHYAELRFSPYYMAMTSTAGRYGVVEAVIDGIPFGLPRS